MTMMQVLVVQENSGVLKGKGVWKMPTGLVHAGEQHGCYHTYTCVHRVLE
jgi:hypothetical protein